VEAENVKHAGIIIPKLETQGGKAGGGSGKNIQTLQRKEAWRTAKKKFRLHRLENKNHANQSDLSELASRGKNNGVMANRGKT
jgi:hypothetical protein